MTAVESIIMTGAVRAKIRSSSELAVRCGTPVSSMRYKMRNPETIRLSDLASWHKVCRFTDEELAAMVRLCK